MIPFVTVYKKVLAAYKKYQLLIRDEWSLIPLSELQTTALFEIVESKYGEASAIFVAQSAPFGMVLMADEIVKSITIEYGIMLFTA